MKGCVPGASDAPGTHPFMLCTRDVGHRYQRDGRGKAGEDVTLIARRSGENPTSSAIA